MDFVNPSVQEPELPFSERAQVWTQWRQRGEGIMSYSTEKPSVNVENVKEIKSLPHPYAQQVPALRTTSTGPRTLHHPTHQRRC